MTAYNARPGSTGDLALRHLAAHGPTVEIALASAIDKEAHELGALLAWPIKQGALKREVRGKDWVYSLGEAASAAAPQSPSLSSASTAAPPPIAISNGHSVELAPDRKLNGMLDGAENKTAAQISDLPKGVAGASRRPETVKETTHRGAAHNGAGEDAEREGGPATPGGLCTRCGASLNADEKRYYGHTCEKCEGIASGLTDEPASSIPGAKPEGLRGKNAALWLTGELAFEATDGTVIVFDQALAKRMAVFLLPMFEAAAL